MTRDSRINLIVCLKRKSTIKRNCLLPLSVKIIWQKYNTIKNKIQSLHQYRNSSFKRSTSVFMYIPLIRQFTPMQTKGSVLKMGGLPTTVCQKLEEPHQTSLSVQTKVTTYQNTPLETFNTSSMVKTKSKYNF